MAPTAANVAARTELVTEENCVAVDRVSVDALRAENVTLAVIALRVFPQVPLLLVATIMSRRIAKSALFAPFVLDMAKDVANVLAKIDLVIKEENVVVE